MEMAKAAENLRTLILNCSTSMSVVSNVINQCEKLESLECTDVVAYTPAVWDPRKPMRLRRLLLTSANGSAFQHVGLVRFGSS